MGSLHDLTASGTGEKQVPEPAPRGGWTGLTDDVARRRFLQWSAIAGGGAGLAACTPEEETPTRATGSLAPATPPDRIVWNACLVNCGSRCPLRLAVHEDQITRVLPDDTGDDEIGTQQIRACVRGRSIRQRIYSPERLKTPMKRVGERGSGEWEEISWEEAYDLIADNLRRVLDEHGNEAVFQAYGTGVIGGTIINSYGPYGGPIQRLMNILGGSLTYYGDYSTGCITEAMRVQYGGWTDTNSHDDWKNSDLVVIFGNDPIETRMSGGGEVFVTQQTKKKHHTRVVVIDPRLSDTAQQLADQWVAIRPGTDVALVAALANVMIREDLHDQDFLDDYCVGFDDDHLPDGIPEGSSYRAYVMGEGPDGVEKTPEWASPITGIPVGTIVDLARQIGRAGTVAVMQGWSAQRQQNGENQSRAIFTLAAMTGSVGVPGGGTGSREGAFMLNLTKPFDAIPNPVKTQISHFTWTDAIDHGPEMTALNAGVRGAERLSAPIKFIWNYGGNTLVNQHSDINRTIELLKDDTKCEFIVVIENQMTVSARYADVLLPDLSNAEQMDIINQGHAGNMGYTILIDKAIEPLYDCKGIYEICSEVAARMGVEQEFTEGRTQEEWVEHTVEETRKTYPDLPPFEELRQQGVYKMVGESVVPLKEFREDPEANPLPTPSGKIEIFSEEVWDWARTWELPEGERITAVPEYVRTTEGAESAREHASYPLQCINKHFKGRTHSTYGNVPWLKEAHPQRLWVNPLDADARGLDDGDWVRVFNDRGATLVQAKVTPRIAPGVVMLPHGAWYDPGADGTDRAGTANVLTSWHPTSLAKSNPQYSTLVEIERTTAPDLEADA